MTTFNPKTVYRMAVCLYPKLTTLDFQGPLEILGALTVENLTTYAALFSKLPDCAIEIEYLSHSLDPVYPGTGPGLLPTKTYKDTDAHYDIIMVPGGPAEPAVVDAIDPSLFDFLKREGPKAKYVLTICTGSWLLARTGLLNGKQATTNKSCYRIVIEDTKNLNIEWIPKARFVINDDKHIWTASGVTAGQDLGAAFIKHLVGEELAKMFLAVVELSHKEEGDDEFAAYFGLV
ncbi:hypothetical protein D9758_005709 [Tetrapyrgos nigripes]|uniref:DJ-1/PfpI domain-containing protein n=1 Tax=Tetrapyrgos nigripes TaxID=182062 RepID=A0A8H5GK72_9AGAR|nr:hypothetical protein D9758_005709 [Tetrapyrgos nigripes]